MEESPASTLPCIVLVRPQMGENIGAAARAMMNFGLHELRLVAPRDGWPNPKAHEMAAHADTIIEQARVFETLEDALDDRQFTLASSARPRQMTIPAEEAPQAVAILNHHYALAEKTALVFGPERSGLHNDDLACCHLVATIPTHPDNASLNIAQSVVILCYHWWLASREISPASMDEPETATARDIEAFYEHLAESLDEKGYFNPKQKEDGMRRSLKSMLHRSRLTRQEVRTWRGIIRALAGQ